MAQQQITIIGGGLVGSLLSIQLAQLGYRVRVLDKRPDPRLQKIEHGRSINLALAHRGIKILTQLGVMPALQSELITMQGRMIHPLNQAVQLQLYGQWQHEVIYSVSRHALNQCLIEAATEYPEVEFIFEQSIQTIDFQQQKIQSGEQEYQYDIVIAADGSYSKIRAQLLAAADKETVCIQPLDHGYKEFLLPKKSYNQYLLNPNALHIWPRGGYMLIGLPNIDSSFTLTLFLPHEAQTQTPYHFSSLNIKQLFTEQFPDIVGNLPDLLAQSQQNPVGMLGTVDSPLWHNEANNVLLIGDAAHGVVPFHGQGMNCGFEDVGVLGELITKHQGDWQQIMPAFFTERKINTDAIATMALENYIEMRDAVINPHYQQKKALSFLLERAFPEQFIPRYSMVMFHSIPYHQAYTQGKLQEQLLDELLAQGINAEHFDEQRAFELIKRYRLQPR